MPRELKCQGNEDIGGFGDSVNRLNLSGCGCLMVLAGGESVAVVPVSLEVAAETDLYIERGGFGWLTGS